MKDLLNIKTIYYEPKAILLTRGQEIMDKFPNAEKFPITTDHKSIPQINKDETNLKIWNKVKENVLVIAKNRNTSIVPGERSSDWAPPLLSDGCTMACVYCYVARRKGYANPITVFTNIEKILDKVSAHVISIGKKLQSTTADPKYWLYDFGGSSDLSVDDLICDNVKDLIETFAKFKTAKMTFATKYVNKNILDYNHKGKTRVRVSLMPQNLATVIDVRTSKIMDRINSINDFVEAGYDVDINLAPVVVYNNWETDYFVLLDLINQTISPKAKKQINIEIIFLTHNVDLHYKNMEWHPKAEDLLWQPELQAKKISRFNHMVNLRYKTGFKKGYVNKLLDIVKVTMPYAKIRYAF